MDNVTIFFCPRCQTQTIRQPNTGDYEHICQNVESLKNESVLIIGNWQDYTGSDVNVQNALSKGTENTLFGTRAAIEGAKFYPRDTRGFPKNLYRARQHIENINEENFDKPKMIEQKTPDNYEEHL